MFSIQHHMTQPRPILPDYFQATLIWWDSPFHTADAEWQHDTMWSMTVCVAHHFNFALTLYSVDLMSRTVCVGTLTMVTSERTINIVSLSQSYLLPPISFSFSLSQSGIVWPFHIMTMMMMRWSAIDTCRPRRGSGTRWCMAMVDTPGRSSPLPLC